MAVKMTLKKYFIDFPREEKEKSSTFKTAKPPNRVVQTFPRPIPFRTRDAVQRSPRPRVRRRSRNFRRTF